MNHNSIDEASRPSGESPVFRIQALRAAYGETGLTLEELAGLAGVPRSLVDALERCRNLPAMLDGLLRIAFALQVPLSDLVGDRRLARTRSGIAARRCAREGGERPPMGFSAVRDK